MSNTTAFNKGDLVITQAIRFHHCRPIPLGTRLEVFSQDRDLVHCIHNGTTVVYREDELKLEPGSGVDSETEKLCKQMLLLGATGGVEGGTLNMGGQVILDHLRPFFGEKILERCVESTKRGQYLLEGPPVFVMCPTAEAFYQFAAKTNVPARHLVWVNHVHKLLGRHDVKVVYRLPGADPVFDVSALQWEGVQVVTISQYDLDNCDFVLSKGGAQ